MLKLVTAIIAFALMIFALPDANAKSSYPSHPIEFLCATSPGSTAAQWCQLMAQVLSKPEVLGAPVHVSYMAGGSGNQAAVYLQQKPADGYTLLNANASWGGYMNLPTFQPKPGDFEFLLRVEKFVYALATQSDSKYKTFGDVVADAKAHPQTIAVAGNKVGSIHQMQILSLFNAAGVKINYIPYKGSGDAIRDVLGHHLPLGLGSIGQLQPYVKAGKLRPLVVINDKRVPAFPKVPTVAELGYNFNITYQWQGIFVKRGTPAPVEAKLRAAFAKVVKSPEYAQYLKHSPHVIPAFSTDGAKLQKDFNAELKVYKTFLKKNGVL